jgi:hypothetical protein
MREEEYPLVETRYDDTRPWNSNGSQVTIENKPEA